MAGRKTIGGGAILVAGLLLFGKETLLWAWNHALDFVSGRAGGVAVAELPWQNIAASILTLTGLAVLLWPQARKPKANPYTVLWTRGDNVVARIRQQRNRGTGLRVVGGEPLTDVIRDGISTLLLFAQQGFAIPKFDTNSAERVAIGLEHYLASMIPLLRDGHIETALTCAAEAANVAQREAAKFRLENWSDDPYTGF